MTTKSKRKKPFNLIQDKSKKNPEQKFGVEIVDKFDEKDLFDDCAICQFEKMAQKRGRPATLDELKNVFQKANKKE